MQGCSVIRYKTLALASHENECPFFPSDSTHNNNASHYTYILRYVHIINEHHLPEDVQRKFGTEKTFS